MSRSAYKPTPLTINSSENHLKKGNNPYSSIFFNNVKENLIYEILKILKTVQTECIITI